MRTKLRALHAEYHVFFQYIEVITVSIIHKIGNIWCRTELKLNFSIFYILKLIIFIF